jgi:hypothetical protein
MGFNFGWTIPGCLLNGFIDLVDPNTHTIYDHKTTTNVKRYAKTEDDLKTDPQTIIYGMAYRVANPSVVDDITLQWTYVERSNPKTKLPHTKQVRLKQSLTDLENGLKVISPIVERIYQIRTKAQAKAVDVEPNVASCDKFNGCPYRALCPDYCKPSPPIQEGPMNLALLAQLSSNKMTAQPLPETLEKEDTVVEPTNMVSKPTASIIEPPKMPLLESLAIQFDTAPKVVPPDAQPNVSPQDPPEPELKAEKPKAKPKAKASAKPTTPQPVVIDDAPTLIDEVPVEDAKFDTLASELFTIRDTLTVDQRLSLLASLSNRGAK